VVQRSRHLLEPINKFLLISRFRGKESSTDVVMTGMKLGPSLGNTLIDNWKDRFDQSDELRGLIEGRSSNGISRIRRSRANKRGLCGCRLHALLCCTWRAGARVVGGRGVCGSTPIFPQGMALPPEKCNKLTRPSHARIIFHVESLSSEEKRM
jgi:hypothetical protein